MDACSIKDTKEPAPNKKKSLLFPLHPHLLLLKTLQLRAGSLHFSPPEGGTAIASNITTIPSFSCLTKESGLLSHHSLTSPLHPIFSPTSAGTHTNTVPTGTFPTTFKELLTRPLLKKPTLGASLVEKYRSVSLAPFLANKPNKMLELQDSPVFVLPDLSTYSALLLLWLEVSTSNNGMMEIMRNFSGKKKGFQPSTATASHTVETEFPEPSPASSSSRLWLH